MGCQFKAYCGGRLLKVDEIGKKNKKTHSSVIAMGQWVIIYIEGEGKILELFSGSYILPSKTFLTKA